jgi:hypothetical protein
LAGLWTAVVLVMLAIFLPQRIMGLINALFGLLSKILSYFW